MSGRLGRAWQTGSRTASGASYEARADGPRPPTRAFVESWIEGLRTDDRHAVAEDSAARTLVRNREVQLKGARARFRDPRRLELWGGESGTWRMSYRWGATKRILKDIFDGLARDEGDAEDA